MGYQGYWDTWDTRDTRALLAWVLGLALGLGPSVWAGSPVFTSLSPGGGAGPWAATFTGLHQLEPSVGNSQHAKHVAVKFKVNSAWVPPRLLYKYIYRILYILYRSIYTHNPIIESLFSWSTGLGQLV